MKNYVWIIAVVVLIFSLSGCADMAEPIVSDPARTVNESISNGMPAVMADKPVASSESTESTVEPDEKAEILGTEKPSTETVKPQEAPAAQSQEAEKPTQQETAPTSKPTEPPKQADPKPSEQPKAQETKPPVPSEPTTTPQTKPEPTPPAETEPPAVTEPVEPAFNINDWIAYAQSYATSVGLRLESSAVDCWDNPITAGVHSQYLERDIQGMLNRYARDEDITDVWIWAQSRSDGSYDLYIGYA